MRVAALDVGRRRTGVAVSDPTGTLARPLGALAGKHMLAEVVRTLETLGREEDGLALVVVGLPRHADGTDSDVTTFVRQFATRVQQRLGCPLVFQDERLTSHEADELLGARERDWRKRKLKLDAAAAAVILQEFLDLHPDGGWADGEHVAPVSPVGGPSTHSHPKGAGD